MTGTAAPLRRSWRMRPRVVKAAVNIVRAAIAGGLHGAAAAAAKELLPTIIKFAVGVLIAIIVIRLAEP